MMEEKLSEMLIWTTMFISTKPRNNMKEAIFIEWDSCSKCYLMKPHAQKRAEANGYEFQTFRFDDTSVKEFDIQSVPMLILKEDWVVKEILDMDGIVNLLSSNQNK